jgi:ATP-dependent Zn protease
MLLRRMFVLVWPPWRRRLCIHEAGHALMACLTRVPYCEVTIDPFLEHGALGGLIGDKTKPATEQWTVNKPEHEAYMLTTAAGIAAEMEIFGEQLKEADVAGATPDLMQLQKIAEHFGAPGDDPVKYAASKIQLARELLRKNRASLEAVARSLSARRRLSFEQVAEILKTA